MEIHNSLFPIQRLIRYGGTLKQERTAVAPLRAVPASARSTESIYDSTVLFSML